MSREECKRCLLLERAREELYQSIQAHLQRIPAKQRAGEELYQKRLALCKECEELISGTCIKCGCYVEFRAAFLNQKCPNAKNRKW